MGYCVLHSNVDGATKSIQFSFSNNIIYNISKKNDPLQTSFLDLTKNSKRYEEKKKVW